MPVMSNAKNRALELRLGERYSALTLALKPRPLKSAREGATGRGSWVRPEEMCATAADAMALRLALADFEAVLKEVKAVAK